MVLRCFNTDCTWDIYYYHIYIITYTLIYSILFYIYRERDHVYQYLYNLIWATRTNDIVFWGYSGYTLWGFQTWLENPCTDFFRDSRRLSFMGIELRMVNHWGLDNPKLRIGKENRGVEVGWSHKNCWNTWIFRKNMISDVSANKQKLKLGYLGWPHNPTKMISKCENIYVCKRW